MSEKESTKSHKSHKVVSPMKNASSAEKANKSGGGTSSRLKPPENRSTSTRLRFNAPITATNKAQTTTTLAAATAAADKADRPFKKYDSNRVVAKSTAVSDAKKTSSAHPVEEKKAVEKPNASAQKASMARLAQSKKLFQKRKPSTDIKSAAEKEPTANQAQTTVPPEVGEINKRSVESEVPKQNIPISTVTSTAPLQMESSMCDDQEDSFMDKNSIAEFELLEKECFSDGAHNTEKGSV